MKNNMDPNYQSAASRIGDKLGNIIGVLWAPLGVYNVVMNTAHKDIQYYDKYFGDKVYTGYNADGTYGTQIRESKDLTLTGFVDAAVETVNLVLDNAKAAGGVLKIAGVDESKYTIPTAGEYYKRALSYSVGPDSRGIWNMNEMNNLLQLDQESERMNTWITVSSDVVDSAQKITDMAYGNTYAENGLLGVFKDTYEVGKTLHEDYTDFKKVEDEYNSQSGLLNTNDKEKEDK